MRQALLLLFLLAQLLATKEKGGIGSGLSLLAACSSGVGKVRSGDEVLGLPRALLEAGANMVVISLTGILMLPPRWVL